MHIITGLSGWRQFYDILLITWMALPGEGPPCSKSTLFPRVCATGSVGSELQLLLFIFDILSLFSISPLPSPSSSLSPSLSFSLSFPLSFPAFFLVFINGDSVSRNLLQCFFSCFICGYSKASLHSTTLVNSSHESWLLSTEE